MPLLPGAAPTPMESLAQSKAYADALKLELESVEAAADPEAGDLLRTVRAGWEAVARRVTSPIRVGIIGEYNAGKWTLLNALAGYAGLLPVGNDP